MLHILSRQSAFVGLLVSLLLLLPVMPVTAEETKTTSGRLFTQTGFKVTNQAFLDFFDHRGGARTFGYPVSRECTFNGSKVQFFQRAIMQLRPDGSVTTLNFLDSGLIPYNRINQSVFPQSSNEVISAAPQPGSANYGSEILNYVKNATPNTWQTMPVNFYSAFLNTVTAKDAFADGKGNMALLSGFAMELWGVPTSAPASDPNNSNFVYQRFQRGIMHYDKTTGTTQGLLLADYLKAILMNENLPADLAADAASSPLFGQYDPSKPNWVARPDTMPNSDLTMAFEPDQGSPTSRYMGRTLEMKTMTQSEFMTAAVPLAQASQQTDKIPTSVTLAQSILETGFGRSELSVKAKNFFGIKAHSGPGTAGTYTINTSECYNGKWVIISAEFRAYYTMAESFADHGRFLNANSRYKSCFETTDPKEWVRRLQSSGYATDPEYANKLIAVMDRYNLYQYDLK